MIRTLIIVGLTVLILANILVLFGVIKTISMTKNKTARTGDYILLVTVLLDCLLAFGGIIL